MKYYKALLAFLLLMQPVPVFALLDQFEGDSAIYSAVEATVHMRPNILFLVDNTPAIFQPGNREAYNPANDYADLMSKTTPPQTPDYSTNAVYERKSATGGTINYVGYIDDISSVSCAEANSAMSASGYFAGPLTKNNGSCTAPNPGNYYLGNLLNYLDYIPPNIPQWSGNTAYQVGDKIRVTASSGEEYVYECSVAGTSGATQPNWTGSSTPIMEGPTTTVIHDDGSDGGLAVTTQLTWRIPGSIMDMVTTTLNQVITAVRPSVKVGLMVFGSNNHGGRILQPIRNIASTDAATATSISGNEAFSRLTTDIGKLLTDSSYQVSGNLQLVNEALYDASLYYKGQNSSSSKLASENTPYPAPFDYSCQRNYVIVLTTGSADNDSQTKNKVGDRNQDGNKGYVDDAAKFLFETTLTGYEEVQTSIIQLLTPEVPRLKTATNGSHGRGEYFHVQNEQELLEAILSLLAGIVGSSDTSFVAPVVPTSPENRTYSGERVYLGFFFPVSQRPWYGNLKKFGISRTTTEIEDRYDFPATSANDGSFVHTAISYWHNCPEEQKLYCADAGQVKAGGTGQKILDRLNDASSDDPVSVKRQIYADISGNRTLKASENAFNSTNITLSDLGVSSDAEKDELINYLYGYDSFDEDGNSNLTEKRGEWILGDILHSKPKIINYNSYIFNKENEGNCNENDTMIYVGGNDGMLHAFRDCNGEEVWAFIPRTVWPNLKELKGVSHSYFVDGSPSAYIYDANHDGEIDPATDKVVLIFGFRRGGDAYYALDVTEPDNPKLLWKLDSSTSGFEELGQTWSDPQIGIVHLSTGNEVVAFVGGGYDRNEDGRFGSTTTFPASLVQSKGEGYVTSTGTTDPPAPNARGRAVYAVRVATLNASGVPTIADSPAKTWGYTSSNHSRMEYSIPSDITVLDSDFDGYADRLYVGDTGGRMWRFQIGSTDKASWTGDIIAFANLEDDYGTPTIGRKIFYRPSVVLEHGYTLVAFGTGDREHPLNKGVMDRLYMIKDKGQTADDKIGFTYDPDYPDDGFLLNLTADRLQESSDTAEISELLDQLNDPLNYGWYINLDRTNASGHAGEKVLASPLIFNKVAYFTTYAPDAVSSTDPCKPGNLGTSRLYAVHYKTGEAVLNFDKTNDVATDSAPNERAVSGDEKTLLRSDRSIELGIGIPSGLVIVMPPNGDAKIFIGCGGGLCAEDPVPGGTTIPLYWIRW